MREIISNTSCIITLEKIAKLNILKELYGEIIIPEKVKEEYGKQLKKWIKVVKIKEKQRSKILEAYIDKGEAEVIILGLQIKKSVVILDDLKARNTAFELGLKVTGTLGILVKAKNAGIINSVSSIFKELDDAGFWVSELLKKETLLLAGEY